MRWLFSAAVLVSSVLVMAVQPMVGRRVLPFLGGSPSVWATCMLFFQAGLLAGYALAHLGPRWLGVRAHALLHVTALAGAFFLLPIRIDEPASSPAQPALWLVATLLATAGLPFALLSASGPLFQKWFSVATERDPYFLYAASNLGSFAALIAYPLLIEPMLPLGAQFEWWRWAFLLLGAATGCCVVPLLRSARATPADAQETASDAAVSWSRMALWVMVAFVPSSLMLSVTTFLTTDVAPIPLLWVMPLGLYLLTFALVFRSGHSSGFHEGIVHWSPLAIIALAIGILIQASEPLLMVLALHLSGFFCLAMLCHGELAVLRPTARHLTSFYLCMAVGGVLGGTLNGLIGPMLFPGPIEYPLMLIAVPLLVSRNSDDRFRFSDVAIPAILFAALVAAVPIVYPIAAWLIGSDLHPVMICGPALISVFLLQDRPVRFGLGLAAVFAAALFHPDPQGQVVARARSFFGSLRVTEKDGMRQLLHGSTLHGMQAMRGELRFEPLTYYHRNGPIGQAMTALAGDERRDRVGIVGLGTGSLAAYSEKGQRYTFFEIDATVVALSRERKLFTYLADAKGDVDIVLGDARLSLAQSTDSFGMLLVDAFGSDAIPIHLLTAEAMDVYDRRLRPNGLLLVHVSNRFLDLEPVLAQHAVERGWQCRIFTADDVTKEHPDYEKGRRASVWIVLARKAEDIPPPLRDGWLPGKLKPGFSTWTDDYANVLSTLTLR